MSLHHHIVPRYQKITSLSWFFIPRYICLEYFSPRPCRSLVLPVRTSVDSLSEWNRQTPDTLRSRCVTARRCVCRSGAAEAGCEPRGVARVKELNHVIAWTNSLRAFSSTCTWKCADSVGVPPGHIPDANTGFFPPFSLSSRKLVKGGWSQSYLYQVKDGSDTKAKRSWDIFWDIFPFTLRYWLLCNNCVIFQVVYDYFETIIMK